MVRDDTLKTIYNTHPTLCIVLVNHTQQVVVDGATSEWIPIVSGLPQGSVLGFLLFMLYTSEMCKQVENRYMLMLTTPLH